MGGQHIYIYIYIDPVALLDNLLSFKVAVTLPECSGLGPPLQDLRDPTVRTVS